MKPQNDPRVISALGLTAQVYGRQLSPEAAAMILSDLSGQTPDEVLTALEVCRRELRYFPTVADIVARIPDGHPGVEEAWSLVPTCEDDSVCWTQEIAQAYNQVQELRAEDPVAARMAFKEIYGRLLAGARSERRPAQWFVSLGHDPAGREQLVAQAVRLGRISGASAQAILPGPAITDDGRAVLAGLGELFKSVLADAPARLVGKHEARHLVDPTEEEIERRKQVLREQARVIGEEP